MALLPPLLANTLTTTSPSFILLSDSLLQPGLLLLRQFITTTLDRNEQVVVISLEQSPSRLIPRNNSNSSATQNQHVDLVDCVSVPPFASTSTLPAGLVNLHEKGGVQLLEKSALEAVRRRKAAAGAGGKVLVVLDSVDALAEKGVHAVFSLLRKVLKELEGSSGSRLIALHHNLFPTPPSPTQLVPSLLPTLLSPSLSSTTIHLNLLPSPLIELLSRDYGLSIPLLPTLTNPLDLRLTSFIESFTSRSWGDPFLRPTSSDQEDERIPIDLGGVGGGGCVVEWSARGVGNVPSLPGSAAAKRGDVQPKRIVSRGLEGLKRTREGVAMVGLSEVVEAKKMLSVTMPESLSSAPGDASTKPSTSTTTTSTKPSEPLLPFNLSLTDAQAAAREDVVLPYLPKAGGGVEYVPDETDEFDDDDPDEDLEI